ncbi:KdsC family phosphatase [Natronospira bacteriovora]|uniref:3-deoxy-D-manno-octulosonate 8-phosphate phosphatase KdsC n=1 Tax=Natronospira bacteriovora TaxID=3069753 RepID=A0ABU0W7U9_9GAMM|nr:HAD-IIIA family hydrolase [Natronospira sp. AB-CW4]MDQ2069535.1 HAD-IIIA family hydrolase [Natronospira sp. AB-CW4]
MIDPGLKKRAADIRLAVFDVDGVLTDGRLYLGPDGLELKVFHTRDGHGLKQLMKEGVEVAIISGRRSQAVEDRMSQLGIRHVFLGVDDKRPCFHELREQLGLPAAQCAFMGDDLVDLPAMADVGLAAAPADAHPAVLEQVHWSSRANGGFGAARECCDLILAARGSDTRYAGN